MPPTTAPSRPLIAAATNVPAAIEIKALIARPRTPVSAGPQVPAGPGASRTPGSPVPPTTPLVIDRTRPMDVIGRRVYMIGIGGCGMSGLALMLKGRGGLISGSDTSPSPFTDMLRSDGIDVGFDQTKQWLPDEVDGMGLVIASAAIRADHPQMLEADRRGVPQLSYAEALGWAMVGMTGVCVAGTHGKSTTTAMLGCILGEAGLDPSVIVGANCAQLGAGGKGGGGFRLGSGTIAAGVNAGDPGLLVVEACEFNRSFHNYSPKLAAINSVEADHLDVYGSLDEVIKSFHEFAKLLPPAAEGGKLLIAEQNAHRREVTAGLACEVQTIGWSPSADWSVRYDPETRRTGLVRKGDGLVAAWVTPMPGDHNAMNAATACVLALWAGADPDALGPAINHFRGLDRRMQLLGEKSVGTAGGPPVRVYDDYGHHPTEVETTLRALRAFEKPETRGGRLICVFQPHQHSRTRHLLEEFASAFSAADLVIVPQIYFVRDSQEEKAKVTSTDLVDRLRNKGVQAMHLHPFEAIVEQLEIACRPGDLLVVMGAGPVDAVGRGFLRAGENQGAKS